MAMLGGACSPCCEGGGWVCQKQVCSCDQPSQASYEVSGIAASYTRAKSPSQNGLYFNWPRPVPRPLDTLDRGNALYCPSPTAMGPPKYFLDFLRAEAYHNFGSGGPSSGGRFLDLDGTPVPAVKDYRQDGVAGIVSEDDEVWGELEQEQGASPPSFYKGSSAGDGVDGNWYHRDWLYDDTASYTPQTLPLAFSRIVPVFQDSSNVYKECIYTNGPEPLVNFSTPETPELRVYYKKNGEIAKISGGVTGSVGYTTRYAPPPTQSSTSNLSFAGPTGSYFNAEWAVQVYDPEIPDPDFNDNVWILAGQHSSVGSAVASVEAAGWTPKYGQSQFGGFYYTYYGYGKPTGDYVDFIPGRYTSTRYGVFAEPVSHHDRNGSVSRFGTNATSNESIANAALNGDFDWEIIQRVTERLEEPMTLAFFDVLRKEEALGLGHNIYFKTEGTLLTVYRSACNGEEPLVTFNVTGI